MSHTVILWSVGEGQLQARGEVSGEGENVESVRDCNLGVSLKIVGIWGVNWSDGASLSKGRVVLKTHAEGATDRHAI